MRQPTHIKVQRDKYMAFALAAADLLVEVGRDGLVVEATGAAQALVAKTSADLVGVPAAGLFAEVEAALFGQLLKKAHAAGRIEPAVLHLKLGQFQPLAVFVGICCLPGAPTACVSLSVMNQSLASHLPARNDKTGLVAMSEFQHMAEKGILPTDPGSGAAMLREMRLVNLGGLRNGLRGLARDQVSALMAEIGAVLNANSIEAHSATQFGDEDFGILVPADDRSCNADQLVADLGETLKAAGLKPDKVMPNVVTVSLAAGDLEERDLTKAFAFIFERIAKGATTPPISLQSAFDEAMADVGAKYSELKSIIDSETFVLHFQPVVDLKQRAVRHFEALVRFGPKNKPFETVHFAENIGLAADLDLAVCKYALRTLTARPDLSVAINLSGYSVQSPAFCETINQLLHGHPAVAGRLLIEVTESHRIENPDPVARFFNGLRRRGFAVCLDDFGAGAAAYNYLRSFDVDYLKIDGQFLKRAMEDKRERALLKSICVLAIELGSVTIGEQIETEEMADFAAGLGIALGQGFLFGKPVLDLPPARPVARNVRRVGSKSGWG